MKNNISLNVALVLHQCLPLKLTSKEDRQCSIVVIATKMQVFFQCSKSCIANIVSIKTEHQIEYRYPWDDSFPPLLISVSIKNDDNGLDPTAYQSCAPGDVPLV